MANAIDEIKALMASKGGLAKTNIFRVILPTLDASVNSREINLLCKGVNIPGRQILTQERVIGTKIEKIAYGFVKDDVSMTFHVMNDYGIRNYFEKWQALCMDPVTYEIGYKDDYSFDVTIQQLKSGRNLPIYSGDFGIINFDINFVVPDEVVYECVLKNAFPTTLNEIPLNNEQSTFAELVIQLSYEDWHNSNGELNAT